MKYSSDPEIREAMRHVNIEDFGRTVACYVVEHQLNHHEVAFFRAILMSMDQEKKQ